MHQLRLEGLTLHHVPMQQLVEQAHLNERGLATLAQGKLEETITLFLSRQSALSYVNLCQPHVKSRTKDSNAWPSLCLSTGHKTYTTLQSLGCPPQQLISPSSPTGGSIPLLRQLDAQLAHRPNLSSIWLFCGYGGRTLVHRRLTTLAHMEANWQWTDFKLYRRLPVPVDIDRLQSTLQACPLILVHNIGALRRLSQLIAQGGLPKIAGSLGSLHKTICTQSGRIALAARQMGWRHVFCVEGMDDLRLCQMALGM